MGDVSGEGTLGALVGGNQGIVYNSYAAGDLSGEKIVCGLVADNAGKLSNTYATGDVNGEEMVGELVGYNRVTISDSYSTGGVEGEEEVGGLVGWNRGGTVENSYWDTETSGMDESDGGTGLTTDEMIGENAPNNMEGFDFEEIWETFEEDHEDAEEDGYPNLQELSREEQLQHLYPAEDDWIPGFISTLLLLGVIFTIAIYSKK